MQKDSLILKAARSLAKRDPRVRKLIANDMHRNAARVRTTVMFPVTVKVKMPVPAILDPQTDEIGGYGGLTLSDVEKAIKRGTGEIVSISHPQIAELNMRYRRGR